MRMYRLNLLHDEIEEIEIIKETEHYVTRLYGGRITKEAKHVTGLHRYMHKYNEARDFLVKRLTGKTTIMRRDLEDAESKLAVLYTEINREVNERHE